MGGLERRDDALEARERLECGERLRVGDGDVARAAAVAQLSVLGSRARVVEAGRDRVRLYDLALLVLHHCGKRSVKDTRAPADRQRRAMPRRVDALTASLHPDQLDILVL